MVSYLELYENLVENIISILKEKNEDKLLLDLNIEKDKAYISEIFTEQTKMIINGKKDYLEWEDVDWIKSMEYIYLGLFSFLYKSKITLMHVYDLIIDEKLKTFYLLEKYKNLVKYLRIREKVTEKQQLYVSDNVELGKLEDKKLYLILNMKKLKNPLVLSYFIDIISYPPFRNYILKNIIDGIDKLNINKMINISNLEEATHIEEIYEYALKEDYFNKFINFIMFIDEKFDIVIRKQIYKKIKEEYIDVVCKSSDVIKIYLKKLDEDYKKNKHENIFKNNFNLKIIDDSENFIETYNMSNNIQIDKLNFDKYFKDCFIDNKKIIFNSKDLINRISSIVFLIIEQLTIQHSKTKKEKVDNFNNFLKDNIENIKKYYIDDNNITSILDDIKLNGVFSEKKLSNFDIIENLNNQIKNNLSEQTFKTKIESLKNVLSKDNINFNKENYDEFKKMVYEFLALLENINTIDVSVIEQKNFTYFSNFIHNCLKNKNNLKLLFVQISDKKCFQNIINYFETYSFFNVNKNIKDAIIDSLLTIITNITKNLNEEEQDMSKIIDFEKFLIFFANIIDYILYYFKKSKVSQEPVTKINKVYKTQYKFK